MKLGNRLVVSLLACLPLARALVVSSILFCPTAARSSSNLLVLSTSSSSIQTLPRLRSPCTVSRRRSTRSALFSIASNTRERTVLSVPEDATATDAVVCGGGPAGLLTAIMLAQKFPRRQVKVFDRLSAPPSPNDESVWSNVAKFYLIGLGSRGQRALTKFGVWEDVEECCTAVVGRKDWAPGSDDGVERIFTDRPVTTQVLPRDKLVGVLHGHIQEKYHQQIELNYGYEVTPMDFGIDGDTAVLIHIAKCEEEMVRANPTSMLSTGQDQPDVLCDAETSTVVTNLLIGADGTSRTIANRMQLEDHKNRQTMNPLRRLFAGKPFAVRRYVDDNQRIYKTIPIKLPAGWRPDLNYSARTQGGRVTFDALPADRNGNYCGVLLLKKDDPLAAPDTDPLELRKLFDDSLPQFSSLIDDTTMMEIAMKPPSFLPGFRFVGPRLYQGERTVVLGDAAHTVKPYFGLGANSALEDVVFLSKAIDETDNLSDAVHQFSKERAGEAEALVRLSRELDRPGTLGFLTFILPLILDSIFHKLAPKLFETNVIAMLQREGYTFRRVRLRKRLDRLGQLVLVGSGIGSAATCARVCVGAIASKVGRRSSTVTAAMAILLVALSLTQKLFGYSPDMAPADVLNKTKDKISNSDTFVTPLGMKEE